MRNDGWTMIEKSWQSLERKKKSTKSEESSKDDRVLDLLPDDVEWILRRAHGAPANGLYGSFPSKPQ